MLGQRPAGLAVQTRQQPGHAGACADPNLPPEETARDQCERVIKPGSEPGCLNIVYPGQRGPPCKLQPHTWGKWTILASAPVTIRDCLAALQDWQRSGIGVAGGLPAVGTPGLS